LLKALYKETFSTVRIDGEISKWFQTVVDVLQGCVLSPLLFCIFLEVVTARVLDTEDIGTKNSGSCLNNLKFADDLAFAAENELGLQDLIHNVDAESMRFGLKISTAKTEVQFIATQEQTLANG